MPFWLVAIAILAATVILGELLQPKIADTSKPARLDEFQIPTAEASRPLCVGWGTFRVAGPNVIWYGDFKTQQRKKRVKSGLFTHKRIHAGYRYFFGFDFSICFGPNTQLLAIEADEKIAWQGVASHGDEFTVDAKTLFGGEDEESDGEGGLFAKCVWYGGANNQAKDAYLVSRLGNTSARRGLAHLVWKGPTGNTFQVANPYGLNQNVSFSGWIGNSQNLKPFAFRARRIPNALLPYMAVNYSNINNGDANPAEVIFEILTDARWGVGLPVEMIDTVSFVNAAEVLFNEGIGFSAFWDSSKPCSDIINSIKRLIDGVVYTDNETGKLKIKLARADYNVADLKSFTKDDIETLSSYSRGSWQDTTNEVRVSFVNRFENFKEQNALAQDGANYRIQGQTVAANIQHLGISNRETAEKITWRDLRAVSLPLAKANFTAKRSASLLKPAETFKFSYAGIKDREGNDVQDLIMRVVKIDYGTLEDGLCKVEAVEDVFSLGVNVYTLPGGTWTNPVGPPAATVLQRADVQPYFFAGDSLALWAFAARPNANTTAFDLYVQRASSDFVQVESSSSFTPTGMLVNAYPRLTAAKDATNTFIVAPTADMEQLGACDEAAVKQGFNLMLCNNEILAYQSYTINVSGQYVFDVVWRGLLDTVPQEHAAGSRVWFFMYGDAAPDDTYATGENLTAKFVTKSPNAQLALSAAASASVAMNLRTLRPFAPGNVAVNDTSTVGGAGRAQITFTPRTRLNTSIVAQNDSTANTEANSKYTIKIYGQTNQLLRTIQNLAAASYDYTAAQEIADAGALQTTLTFQLYAEREGLTSYQAQHFVLTRSASAPANLPAFVPSGTYAPITPGTAVNINGVPIVGAPTATNNVPVYNPTTGQIEWNTSPGLTVEDVQDIVASFIQAGSNISVSYNDAANTLTISTNLSNLNEAIDDRVAALLVAGTNTTIVYNDAANTLTINGASFETIQDDVAAFIQPGNLLTKFYDDASNVLNLNANAEALQDMIATFLVGSSSVAIAYDDTNNQLVFTATGGVLNPSRANVAVTTAALANNAVETGTIALGKSFSLINILTSHAARIRLYSTAAARTADAARPFTGAGSRSYLGKSHGIICDVKLDGTVQAPLDWLMSPRAVGSNGDTTPSQNVYYSIQNISGASASITVNFNRLEEES